MIVIGGKHEASHRNCLGYWLLACHSMLQYDDIGYLVMRFQRWSGYT